MTAYLDPLPPPQEMGKNYFQNVHCIKSDLGANFFLLVLIWVLLPREKNFPPPSHIGPVADSDRPFWW